MKVGEAFEYELIRLDAALVFRITSMPDSVSVHRTPPVRVVLPCKWIALIGAGVTLRSGAGGPRADIFSITGLLHKNWVLRSFNTNNERDEICDSLEVALAEFREYLSKP